jgi:DNA-binding FrmR family transcriptional regulator
MELPERRINELAKRQRRGQGQIREIQLMLVDGRDC